MFMPRNSAGSFPPIRYTCGSLLKATALTALTPNTPSCCSPSCCSRCGLHVRVELDQRAEIMMSLDHSSASSSWTRGTTHLEKPARPTPPFSPDVAARATYLWPRASTTKRERRCFLRVQTEDVQCCASLTCTASFDVSQHHQACVDNSCLTSLCVLVGGGERCFLLARVLATPPLGLSFVCWQDSGKPDKRNKSLGVVARQSQVRDFMTKVAYRAV